MRATIKRVKASDFCVICAGSIKRTTANIVVVRENVAGINIVQRCPTLIKESPSDVYVHPIFSEYNQQLQGFL